MVSPLLVQNVGSILMALVATAGFYKLYTTYKENNVHSIKNLAIFFGFFAVFQFVLGIRYFLPLSEVVQARMWAFSHIFLYISLAYFSRIAIYIVKPEWEKWIFRGILAYGVVATAYMIAVANTVTPLIAIPALAVWLVLGTGFFLRLAWKSEGVKRLKMILISAGIFLIALAGPLHNIPVVEQNALPMIVVEFLTVLGTIVAITGVYYDHLIRE
jgi:hypothetical protein